MRIIGVQVKIIMMIFLISPLVLFFFCFRVVNDTYYISRKMRIYLYFIYKHNIIIPVVFHDNTKVIGL